MKKGGLAALEVSKVLARLLGGGPEADTELGSQPLADGGCQPSVSPVSHH